MKALYVRFVLFFIGPAITWEIEAQEAQREKERAATLKKISMIVDTATAQTLNARSRVRP